MIYNPIFLDDQNDQKYKEVDSQKSTILYNIKVIFFYQIKIRWLSTTINLHFLHKLHLELGGSFSKSQFVETKCQRQSPVNMQEKVVKIKNIP